MDLSIIIVNYDVFVGAQLTDDYPFGILPDGVEMITYPEFIYIYEKIHHLKFDK